jgi:hypothetical protein
MNIFQTLEIQKCRFIVTNLRERPNILKFKQIMSAYQKLNLEKLCKFIRNINKCFVL